MQINKRKKIAALLSIISNVTLTALKIFAGIITGSLSIISEAIHSFSDLFASFLTFISVSKSSKPADADHPYGHGKYEDLSGFIEGILIILASIFILYESTRKIILNSYTVNESNIAIIVMLVAVIANTVVSSILFKVAKESNSVSLYADAEHLRTDIYSSFGVFAGLILIKVTGYNVLDPIVAILVAIFIYKAGYSIVKETIMNLVDHSLPDEEIEKIKKIIQGFSGEVRLKNNEIKTRKTGPNVDIDIILQFKEDTTICKCHKICDKIEKQIKELYLNCSISIHLEPVCYKDECLNSCKKECHLVK